MTMARIVYRVLVGCLLALAARLLAAALALLRHPTRWFWLAALVGFAWLGIAAPHEQLGPRAVRSGNAATLPARARTNAAPSLLQTVESAQHSAAFVTQGVVPAVRARVPESVTRPLLLGWVILSTLLLSLYLCIQWQVARALRSWPRDRLHGFDVRITSAGHRDPHPWC